MDGQPELVGNYVLPLPRILQIFSRDEILGARGISVEPEKVLAHGCTVTHEWVSQRSMKNSPDLQGLWRGFGPYERHGVWFLASSRPLFAR